MVTPDYYLAQVNIARMKAPLTDPAMAGFAERLDEINALAEASEGFVWRLTSEPENEAQVLALESSGVLFNLSVWATLEALQAFVYESAHAELLNSRGAWFETPDTPHMALWWVPSDHIPVIDEAMLRLDRLEMLGPAQNSFTFAKPFPPPQRRRRGRAREEK